MYGDLSPAAVGRGPLRCGTVYGLHEQSLESSVSARGLVGSADRPMRVDCILVAALLAGHARSS